MHDLSALSSDILFCGSSAKAGLKIVPGSSTFTHLSNDLKLLKGHPLLTSCGKQVAGLADLMKMPIKGLKKSILKFRLAQLPFRTLSLLIYLRWNRRAAGEYSVLFVAVDEHSHALCNTVTTTTYSNNSSIYKRGFQSAARCPCSSQLGEKDEEIPHSDCMFPCNQQWSFLFCGYETEGNTGQQISFSSWKKERFVEINENMCNNCASIFPVEGTMLGILAPRISNVQYY